jgi:hypothetical protein
MPGPCSNGTILAMARRVLIVDDSAGFRVQARALLVAAGYDVVGEAMTGPPGFAWPGSCRPRWFCSTCNLSLRKAVAR